MDAAGEFTASLWHLVEDIYKEIIDHPFVRQLAEGTLPLHSFAHYLSQDILYLRDDSLAFEKLAEKAPSIYEYDFFKKLASDGIAFEQDLQNYFLDFFKVDKAKTKSPVIYTYTSFLFNHVRESSYSVAAAALLPCFWIYNKMGNLLLAQSANNNVYQKWIDTYESAEYEAYTRSFIKIVEDLSINLSYDQKALMKQAFIEATKLELAFFEESYLK